MARQIIGIGTTANDGTGDTLRTAFDKTNQNFEEVYGNVADLRHSVADVVTSDYTVVNSDLVGGVLRTFNSASPIVVTVPSGLTALGPLTLVNIGSGTVTVAAGAGVFVNSADARFQLRTRYSSASLVPTGVNLFVLIGDLTA